MRISRDSVIKRLPATRSFEWIKVQSPLSPDNTSIEIDHDPEAANRCRELAYELLKAADRVDGTDGRAR